jgi:zinc transport system ATP-binding protein
MKISWIWLKVLKKQIEVKNLSFSYGKSVVLEDINLDVYEGDFLAIIGPNGGGKTTFIKLLLGLRDFDKGEIKIFGKSVKEARGKIGYLPQYINFNMDMPISVEDIVLQGRLQKNKLFYSKEDRDIVKEQLKKMKILELANRKINELSGGQRQRVLLARALAREPEIIILDEPTASIDLEGQKEIYSLLKTLPQTKIVVSHDINILFEGVNRVAHIQRKLHLHNGLAESIKRDDGHFCEMELLEIIRDRDV